MNQRDLPPEFRDKTRSVRRRYWNEKMDEDEMKEIIKEYRGTWFHEQV